AAAGGAGRRGGGHGAGRGPEDGRARRAERDGRRAHVPPLTGGSARWSTESGRLAPAPVATYKNRRARRGAQLARPEEPARGGRRGSHGGDPPLPRPPGHRCTLITSRFP